MKNLSQLAMKYPIHIILNKRKLKKEASNNN